LSVLILFKLLCTELSMLAFLINFQGLLHSVYFRLIEKACQRLTKLESEGHEFYDAWNRTSVDLVKAAKVCGLNEIGLFRDINVTVNYVSNTFPCTLCYNVNLMLLQ